MSEEEIEKVKRKVPIWFKKTEQKNSKLLIKFLELSDKDTKPILKAELEKNCQDIFSGNYSQMKNEGEKNNAQVFYESNNYIQLQPDVKDFILKQYDEIFLPNIQSNNGSKEEQLNLFNIKNIILYGIAGVGKTHNTNKLISLIESGQDEKEIFEIIKENENSDSVDISDIKDRVKFITFHQGFGYEDFIEGFRPNEDGKIELVDGIFKSICEEAQRNLDKSKEENQFDTELFLNDFIESVEIKNSYEIDKDIEIRVKRKKNGDFISFITKGRVRGQSLTKDIIKRDIENFLYGEIVDYKYIKPKFESKSSYHGNAPYYYKLYQKMEEFFETTDNEYKVTKEEKQNYYLIIDEINRGNISKIFGELITLIEESKRDNLEVVLPYSKEPFKVPSNLYIIGTMNSSDKSIALIDIALRRRFTFLKMKPKDKLVPQSSQELFKRLNEYILKTLGEDKLIGHSYFMGGSDLDFVLEYQIKPLLEEYFYGDSKGLDSALEIIGKNQ